MASAVQGLESACLAIVSAASPRGLGVSQLKDALEDLGCWWLAREIEIAAALQRYVLIDDENLVATWTLPVSKTDLQGYLVQRSHKCYCEPLPKEICPFHQLKAQVGRLDGNSDESLLPAADGSVAASKQ